MWQAAVAVNDICVKKGKAGAAFGLGEFVPVFRSRRGILMRRDNIGDDGTLMLSLGP